MNIERLRTIQQWFNEHPQQFDMVWWSQEKDCGTTYCIAGLAIHLWESEDSSSHNEQIIASSLLDLTSDEQIIASSLLDLTGDEAWKLFYMSMWPEQFKLRDEDTYILEYINLENFNRRMDHFIATGGAE